MRTFNILGEGRLTLKLLQRIFLKPEQIDYMQIIEDGRC